jgi:hypothetical protein
VHSELSVVDPSNEKAAILRWQPVWESNPSFGLERAAS